MLSPVRMEFNYEVVRLDDGLVAATGRTVHAALDVERQTVPAAGSGSARCSHEGAGHRRGRLHRIAPDGALLDARGAGRRRRLLHRLLPARDQGSATSRSTPARRDSEFVEAPIQDADLPALLDGVTHVFHLAAQAGVRKSWGRDFQTYTENNVDASQQLLEACVGRPLEQVRLRVELVAVRRRGQRSRCAKTRCRSRLSPYGVTKLAAEQLCYLYQVNHRVPTTSVRYFTVYGPRQRPDMAFNRFIRAALDAASRSRSTATASRRATSRS